VKYLVLCGPMVQFLIKKFQMKLPPNLALGNVLKLFFSGIILNPTDSGEFISILSKIQQALNQTDMLYKKAVLRKYVGNGETLKGLLNFLKEASEDLYIYNYIPDELYKIKDSLLSQFPDGLTSQEIKIIAPLNLDVNDEIYTFFHKKHNIPVYPLTYNKFASKWVKNIVFSPLSPTAFYFPEDTNALDYLELIVKIMAQEGIGHVFLKDEYDFNSGAAVPYYISNSDCLKEYLTTFYKKARGVSNLGGLVMEEFLGKESTIDIYKSHFFNTIIPGEHLHYTVSLKDIPGGAPYEPLISKVKEQTLSAEEHPSTLYEGISSKLSIYFPYVFSSIDYIFQNQIPKVIDLNSIAGSLGYVQEVEQNELHNPFIHFIEQIKHRNNGKEYENQIKYIENINSLYEKVHSLGPCFIKGEKIIQLKDNNEILIRTLINFS
jgi:hypothetical protein